MSVEIRHLRQFVAVAEELHFTRAADRLHIAQPALSAQIRRLEDALGLKLFERSTRTVTLTDDGEAFFAAAKTVLEKWDEALFVAASRRKGRAGHVSLGVSLRINSRVLGAIQEAVTRINPRIALDVIAERTPRLVEGVAEQRLDLALCVAPDRRGDVRQQLVRNDPIMVALPSDHPLADRSSIDIRELRNEKWVLPRRGLRSVILLQEMCRVAGYEMRVSDVVSADFDDTFTPTRLGHGVEVVPSVVLPSVEVKGIAVVPLADRSLPVEMLTGIATPGSPLSTVMRAITEVLGDVPDGAVPAIR